MHLNRVLRETGVVLAAGLLYGSAAFAQSSTMIGTVIDAQSRNPVPDVVVTATSPNLQGEQTVVTDAQGNYRIPQLPPGVYTLRFEKEQFKPYARSDVQLRLNRTIRVNVELLPESLGEVVEIVGAPPTIDVGSTTTGVNVDQEFIKRIAVARPGGKGGASRSFESLAELAPGAQTDQYGVSINGATSPENGYVVDGLSTNDPAFGVNASPLSIEFVQDVNIITGGYMPEFGRSTGGVVNAVTRSGSNEFHGSVFANWTPGTLEGNRKLVREEGTVITGLNALRNLGDFGGTLGGPILKDKLWFFAGFAPSFTRYEHTRTLNALQIDESARDYATDENGFTVANVIPGSERRYFADARSLQYMGKLTYLINQDHNVSFAVNGTPSSTGGLGKLTLDPRTGLLPGAITSRPGDFGLTENNTNTTALGLKYAGAFMDKKVLVDANLGWFHQTASTLPGDGSRLGSTTGLAGYSRMSYRDERSLTVFEGLPAGQEAACDPFTYTDEEGEEQTINRCPVTGYTVGGPAFMSDAKLDRYQINAKATYLLNALGTHVLKAGVDTEFLVYDQTKAYGGGVFYSEGDPYPGSTHAAVGGRALTDFRRYGYQSSPDTPITQLTQQAKSTSTTVGGFVQDSWSIANRVTLNLGVRYDVQAMYGGDGTLALILGNQLSPRVGAILDPFANGRAKLFVNFARYYEQVPLNLLDRAFPGERRFVVWRSRVTPRARASAIRPAARARPPTARPLRT